MKRKQDEKPSMDPSISDSLRVEHGFGFRRAAEGTVRSGTVRPECRRRDYATPRFYLCQSRPQLFGKRFERLPGLRTSSDWDVFVLGSRKYVYVCTRKQDSGREVLFHGNAEFRERFPDRRPPEFSFRYERRRRGN